EIVGISALGVAADALLPLVIVAEFACWYAVLSLNHLGHAVEESLWAVMMAMLSAATGVAALAAHGPRRVMLIVVSRPYAVGAGLTTVFAGGIYIQRRRKHPAGRQLTLATGFWDSRSRRHATSAWEIWREEVPWMTLYFSFGVWTSLAMILLEFV